MFEVTLSPRGTGNAARAAAAAAAARVLWVGSRTQLVGRKDGLKSLAGMIFAHKIRPQEMCSVEEFYQISVSH